MRDRWVSRMSLGLWMVQGGHCGSVLKQTAALVKVQRGKEGREGDCLLVLSVRNYLAGLCTYRAGPERKGPGWR